MARTAAAHCRARRRRADLSSPAPPPPPRIAGRRPALCSAAATPRWSARARRALDIAARLGSSGILVVGGVQRALRLRHLIVDNTTTLLAALSPGACSTASLTVGGTFEVQNGGRVFECWRQHGQGRPRWHDPRSRDAHGHGRRLDRQPGHDRSDGGSDAGAAAAECGERAVGHRHAADRPRCHVEAGAGVARPDPSRSPPTATPSSRTISIRPARRARRAGPGAGFRHQRLFLRRQAGSRGRGGRRPPGGPAATVAS